VTPSLTAALVARLERIENLARDLGRDLTRSHPYTAFTRDMAAAIKQEADAVDRLINSPKS
jgi:hypothetical protein